jgi:hypothetical protein
MELKLVQEEWAELFGFVGGEQQEQDSHDQAHAYRAAITF